MNKTSPRYLLTASGLALLLALSPALAQQSATADTAQAAANQNEPLKAPESQARRQQVMPESFADLVEQVSPAVVNITTTATVSTPLARGPQLPEGSPFSDLFREFGFPGLPPGPNGRSPVGQNAPEQRSNALGRPPRCTWPRIVTRVSSPRRCSMIWRTCSDVIALPSRSVAPSATTTIESRRPAARPRASSAHMRSSQPASGGSSGIST